MKVFILNKDNKMELCDKYSPKTWDDLIGQDRVINIFKNIIKFPNKFPKNLILNGAFGTGKTSSARIFASELNKIKHTRTYEFDLTSIGNKNELKEIKSRIDNMYKHTRDYLVLIFDEIQEASSQAQSLFMKTLEDNIKDDNTDRNIYFLFVTTDSSKLIDTLVSRCIELNFCFISPKDIRTRLDYIIQEEKINITDKYIEKIIDLSEGHLRNAIKLLNKYLLAGDNIDNIFFDTQKILKDYIFSKDVVNINNIVIYPVNILVRDLNKVIIKYIDSNIDNNYMRVLKLMEIFFKFRNYINSIEDFISVIKILKKFFK